MKVYERYHLYVDNTLSGVYETLNLVEQDVADNIGGKSFVVEKVVETHTIHTVYGLPNSPIPPKPPKAIPVSRKQVSRWEIMMAPPNPTQP